MTGSLRYPKGSFSGKSGGIQRAFAYDDYVRSTDALVGADQVQKCFDAGDQLCVAQCGEAEAEAARGAGAGEI